MSLTKKLVQTAAVTSLLLAPYGAMARTYLLSPKDKPLEYRLTGKETVFRDYLGVEDGLEKPTLPTLNYNLLTVGVSNPANFSTEDIYAGSKPRYLQPSSSYDDEGSSRKGGCGSTCTIIGAALAGVCGTLLVLTLDKQKEVQESEAAKSTGQDPTKSTGPIVLGIGALAGLGIMIYGISTTD